jgi:UDP-GlcNAc:undecaprenyl-phosphate GlcNAc-1-phosphate transferase
MFFILTMSVIISMAVIPIMMRLATALRMVDEPDEERKVHTIAVPRVGGWGMVLGTIIAISLFLEIDSAVGWYLVGSLVLLGFGAKDDQADIGHYPKFLGQFLGVIPLVVLGGVQVEQLPFIDAVLPGYIAIPFTVIAMVGAINALNHSDGLDGLAGGEALLSLSALTLIGLSTGLPLVTYISLASIGGILGFLRFNTHPARVFMGDSGSQFLGFTVAFLVVYIIQNGENLSPSLAALLIGLPIIDILAVFWQRAYQGLNWFKATRNHIHHRLLHLGFKHYESVVIIYGIQAFFIVNAIFLQSVHDAVILGLYLGTCTLVFTLLMRAERAGWRVRNVDENSESNVWPSQSIASSWLITDAPLLAVSIGIPSYVLGSCTFIDVVPWDYGWTAVALFVLLLFDMLRARPGTMLGPVVIYTAALFVVFLTVGSVEGNVTHITSFEIIYFGILAGAIGLGIRFSRGVTFSTTPLDYLVLFTVVLVAVFPLNSDQTQMISVLAIEGFIILYGCELLLNRAKSSFTPLNLAALGALGFIGVRGGDFL